MVTRAYMLEKPKGPSASKVFFDQKIIPAMINSAGGLEGLLERVAVRGRRYPLMTLGAAFGIGTLVSLLMKQGWRSAPSPAPRLARGSPLESIC